VDYSQRHYDTALKEFGEALKLNPALQHDPALAVSLAGLLLRDYDATAALIRAHPSKPIVAELSRRSGSANPAGRKAAIRMLRELRQERRIDYTGDAIAALKEGETCDERLKAVRRLAQLKDKRALQPLREAVGSGFSSWFANGCLRGEANAAIKELEQQR
jgi:hypothetical protein